MCLVRLYNTCFIKNDPGFTAFFSSVVGFLQDLEGNLGRFQKNIYFINHATKPERLKWQEFSRIQLPFAVIAGNTHKNLIIFFRK